MDTADSVPPAASETAPEAEAKAKGTKWYRSGRFWIPAVVVVVLIGTATGIVLATRSSSSRASNARASGAGSVAATTVPGQGAVGTGYLASDSGGVIFIQWTQSGTSVDGTAQVDTLAGSPPNQSVSTKTITITGQLQGSTISRTAHWHR